jgi:cytochrome c oxidase subunit II
MIERYIEPISTYASSVDNLILLIAVLVGFWFFLCEGMFFWLIWRYRARDGHRSEYITGDEKHLKRWITIPHALVLVCDIAIIIGAVRVWVEIKQTLPTPDATVRVIGQQWAWSFVHPGPDNKLDTPDDIRTVDDLHVEVDKVYHVEMTSRDVLHSFSVPVFRLKQDVIPGRVIKGWFKATKTGQHDIQCAEICGIGHGVMAARIFIESAEEHGKWVTANAGTPPPTTAAAPAAPAPAPAAAGE